METTTNHTWPRSPEEIRRAAFRVELYGLDSDIRALKRAIDSEYGNRTPTTAVIETLIRIRRAVQAAQIHE